jgi:hypothetical protein
MSKSLNEIIQTLLETCWTIDEAEGVIDEDMEQQLDDVEAELTEKVNSCLRVADDMTAKAAALKTRAQALMDMSKGQERQAERLREYVLTSLETADISKLPTLDYPRCGVRKNNPSVLVRDGAQLLLAGDGKYSKTKTVMSIDKKKVLADLKAGMEIEGAEIQQTTRLNWK